MLKWDLKITCGHQQVVNELARPTQPGHPAWYYSAVCVCVCYSHRRRAVHQTLLRWQPIRVTAWSWLSVLGASGTADPTEGLLSSDWLPTLTAGTWFYRLYKKVPKSLKPVSDITHTRLTAPRSRQITTPAPHHSSFFYRLDALPAAQPTVSKHWRHTVWDIMRVFNVEINSS